MSEKSDEKSYRATVPLAFHISIYFSQTTDPIRTKLDRKKHRTIWENETFSSDSTKFIALKRYMNSHLIITCKVFIFRVDRKSRLSDTTGYCLTMIIETLSQKLKTCSNPGSNPVSDTGSL
jgi:hypothetical protein